MAAQLASGRVVGLSDEAVRVLSKVGYRHPHAIEIEWEDEDDECGCHHMPADLYESEDRAGLDELTAAGLIKDRGDEFQVSPGAIFGLTAAGLAKYNALNAQGRNHIFAITNWTGAYHR